MTSPDPVPETQLTRRSQLKADRRKQLLAAAARLIAERGYAGVRLEDIGAEAGISGPAVYRHFPNKEAVLTEILLDASRRLHDGGLAVADGSQNAVDALAALIDFHLDFAVSGADVIRIQDRDMHVLPEEARHQVRLMQRRYVERWVAVLRQLDPDLDAPSGRVKAHAVFGLLNSTPHSGKPVPAARTRQLLREMALSALAPPRTP
jgi:AcrR family transcriptional regulator